MIFDENLKWKFHIEIVITRLRKCFNIFEEIRNILEISSLKMICFALVQSYINVWDTCMEFGSYVLKRLNVTHRILISVIMKNFYNIKTNTRYIP